MLVDDHDVMSILCTYLMCMYLYDCLFICNIKFVLDNLSLCSTTTLFTGEIISGKW